MHLHRSLLYVPGSREDLIAKALASAADAIIIDLEDAVADSAKDQARQTVSTALQSLSREIGDGSRPAITVRINNPEAGMLEADLEAAVWPAVSALRLPKAETPQQIQLVSKLTEKLESQRGISAGSTGLSLIIESAKGALAMKELLGADPRVQSISLGASDYLADLKIVGNNPLATLVIRSEIVMLSRAFDLASPTDGVFTDITDLDGLREAALEARSLGFFGKSVIHPSHIAVVNEVFTPTAEEITEAENILAAASEAESQGVSALKLGTNFIDPAIVARARAILNMRKK